MAGARPQKANRGSQVATPSVWKRSVVEAAAEPILHATGKRPPALVAALTQRRGGRAGVIGPPGQPGTGDREYHSAEHDDEPEYAEDREVSDHRRLERHSGDQHRQTDDEQRHALQPPTGGRCAQTSAADA